MSRKNDHLSPRFDKAALLTIDVQNDFAWPNSVFEIEGTANMIPAMQRLADAFRKAGQPIIHVIRIYKADGSNADLCRKTLVLEGKPMARPDSRGVELVDPLKSEPQIQLNAELLLSGGFQTAGENEWIMYKPRWGAFYATQLDSHLRTCGVDTLIICGCNFPNCPRATVYEASERDYRIVLVSDATSRVYQQGLKELRDIGVNILTVGECLRGLQLTDSESDGRAEAVPPVIGIV